MIGGNKANKKLSHNHLKAMKYFMKIKMPTEEHGFNLGHFREKL